MSLQTDADLDFEVEEIDALMEEHGFSFQKAARLHWFGYRPRDGRTINPLVLDMSRTSLDIARELNAAARAIFQAARAA